MKLTLVDVPWWRLGRDLDKHGQPRSTYLRHRQNVEKAADELIGICKGLVVDGIVSDDEVVFLRRWIADHAALAAQWPIREVTGRLESIFADEKIDEKERAELRELLVKLSGGIKEPPSGSTAAAMRLPIDDPAPPVVFAKRAFVTTGQFIYGGRDRVHGCIMERGGAALQSVTKVTDFLVIGALASRDWAHASYGRKIEKAVQYRASGARIKIVAEEHWVTFL